MLENFFTYIKNYVSLYNYKVKKPVFVVPRSFTVAFEELKNDNSLKRASYKLYPDDNKIIPAKISIDKITLQGRIKYIFSAWVGDKEFLKFREDDYDHILDLVFTEIKEAKENIITKSFLKIQEKFASYTEAQQEYYIDYIYKNYPNKLFGFRNIVFSTKTNTYMKQYYMKILNYFFQLCTYDMLIEFEAQVTEDTRSIETTVLKEKLLRLIQQKNLLDIKLSNLTNTYNIKL